MKYCRERKLAFSHVFPTTIQNLAAVYVLTAECGIEMQYRFFEELTYHKANPKILGTYYASFKLDLEIITEKPSKVDDWEQSYFFMKIDVSSGLARDMIYQTEWYLFPGRSIVDRNKCF